MCEMLREVEEFLVLVNVKLLALVNAEFLLFFILVSVNMELLVLVNTEFLLFFILVLVIFTVMLFIFSSEI